MNNRADVDDATADAPDPEALDVDETLDETLDEAIDIGFDEEVETSADHADDADMTTLDVDVESDDTADNAAEVEGGDEADLDTALRLDAALRLASDDPAEWRRVRKWDRPPDPHDWRYFVGAIGRIMLATGVLMFGFVAYQLWGTGIETARAQNSLEDQFSAVLADQGVGEITDGDTSGTATNTGLDDAGTTGADGSAADAAEATDATDGSTDESADAPTGRSTAPADDGIASIPEVPDLADDAIEQDIPEIERGDALARLEIPRIGQDVYVVPGVNIDDLKDGPGHYPDTPLPGQLGNSAIAGHRTTYGSPFFDVDQLVAGDELRVTMLTGDQFVYEVTDIEIVEATDYWVVSTTNPDTAELTLTSCHPKYSARQRIIVRSVLNPEKSANVGFPTTYELESGNDAPIPGDDPVIEADDPQLVLGDSSSDEPGPATPADDDRSVDTDSNGAPDGAASEDSDDESGAATDRNTESVDTGSLADTAGLAAGDEFARGWFDDSAAWPQILLWGLALIAIALGAHRLSRRFRRDLIGAAVGIVPFVVVLYFFFQNVHRLLPPGI